MYACAQVNAVYRNMDEPELVSLQWRFVLFLRAFKVSGGCTNVRRMQAKLVQLLLFPHQLKFRAQVTFTLVDRKSVV